MAETKTKPAAKKMAATKTKAGSAAPAKPKPANAKAAGTAKRTAVKKTAAKVAEPKKAKPAAVKKTSPPAPAKNETAISVATPKARTIAKPTPEERYRMVETAAYFIAEQHGFQGRSDEHWAAAEREIAKKLGQ